MAAWPTRTDGGAGAPPPRPPPTPLPCRREQLRWRPDLPAELDSELGGGADDAGSARDLGLEGRGLTALGSRSFRWEQKEGDGSGLNDTTKNNRLVQKIDRLFRYR
jgi:hypothetical protein